MSVPVRDVRAHLELRSAGAEIALAIAPNHTDRERLAVTSGGVAIPWREEVDGNGTRLVLARIPDGVTTVEFSASVTSAAPAAEPTLVEEWTFLRPSRYCESDVLRPIAVAEFAGLRGVELLRAVSSWVGTQLAYVPGSSGPTDGAVATLLARRGVCRDFAHLVVALLRALDVPARVVAVYAPGLDPMDFHAVAEAAIDGRWRVVDATTLAPRSTLVRIATGRDASDTAFLTSRDGGVELLDLEVVATAEVLPDDDLDALVSI